MIVGLGAYGVPSVGAVSRPASTTPRTGSGSAGDARSASNDEEKGYYDARTGYGSDSGLALDRAAAKASSRRTTQTLRVSVGGQAVVEMDGLTGTPREVARLDGFLTARNGSPARVVALNYVRAHLSALGLTSADLSTMTLKRDYVDIAGIHHLSWTQSAGGVELFGNGLQASVTKDGRLLTLGGSPVSGLRAPRSSASSKIASSSSAILSARADLGEPRTVGPADYAKPVLFQTPQGTRRAWEAVTMSTSRPTLTVLDAADGRVLLRQDLSSDAVSSAPMRTPAPWAASMADRQRRAESRGLAVRYFPGHNRGGREVMWNYTKNGWLGGNIHILRGNNSHTYADVNDDNMPNPKEEIPPRTPHTWDYRLKPFHLKHVSFCDNPYPCSWNPNKPFSWRTNRNQNAAQVFYFVNQWHDFLKSSPIGFTEAAGNFQRFNTTGRGEGGDAVETQTDDGANTDHGLPDGNHIDNANMSTHPDGHPPTMQMYLQHAPGTSYPDGDPFAPTNVGDEADTVYHEYTHGLSNRLVVDANGHSTLGPVQAGSMGEAWSDWYAMDYLVANKLQHDYPMSGDVVLFQYDGQGVFLDRTEPLDCAVGAKTRRCGGGATGHRGGYTYADFGDVIGFPEVHADGEIWAQTLWDLRNRIGSRLSESLVTRAMELSPANPSFLDERNAILLADQALHGGSHQHAIWSVFAHRGMGYFAGSLGGNDTTPGASFALPPKGSQVGSLVGTVRSRSGRPIQGATVSLAFQGSPFVTNPSDITNAKGRYSIGPVPFGRYPKLVVNAKGYDSQQRRVTVGSTSAIVVNFTLRRDWAAYAGGARVVDFTGPDYSGFGCGPRQAIDQSDATGWSTTSELDNGQAGPKTPKSMVVRLPRVIDIAEITVNPSANCGDGLSASTGGYRVEVSPDGSTGSWTTVSEGEFLVADQGRFNSVPLTGPTTGVRFVRFTIKAPLVVTDTANYPPDACPGGGYSGCQYEDLTELKVFS
ncbi:MAG: M36 family metallopeptidase [Nocardioidaceae bacterium]